MRQRVVMVRFLLAIALAIVAMSAMAARGPATARIVDDDIGRFWRAYDLAAAAPSAQARAAVYQREYLDAGSTGLREFTRLRIEGGAQLSATIDRHPRYYASLRARTEDLSAQEPAIRAGLHQLHALLPEARFPDVYLLLGRMSSGGTLTDAGLLIGVEMYGLAADTPTGELGDWHRAVLRGLDELPRIVVHELVHYQQRGGAAEPTLLQQSLVEGVADFITELATGAHVNGHVHAWAEPRAVPLWNEFRERMHGRDFSGWLYDTAPGDGRPADLGYWAGYRIAKAYYARAADKPAALRDLLAIDDADAFLARSGLEADLGLVSDPAGSH